MIIAALASAPGQGGISVIRVSGENSIQVVLNYFTLHKLKSISFENVEYFKLYYGYFHDSQKNIIDEITIAFFKKGKSYSGEESVEIYCHGAPIIVKKILSTLYATDKIRQANGGEFTFKRFMNNKMDLVQAESVMDLINSESDTAYKSSKEQLEGVLSKELNNIKQKLIDLLSILELELDFSEEEIEFLPVKKIDNKFLDTLKTINRFIDSYKTGKKYRDGINVVIAGNVNAGKSSLMNRLLNSERVIVTKVEGTTRDIIEEKIEVDGYLLKITDTAGLRKTSDIVEQEGIKRTLQAIDDADILLHLIDVNRDDIDELVKKYDEFKDKTIKVFNKIDKVDKSFDLYEDILQISCKNNIGIDILKNDIIKKATKDNISYQPSYITNIRHFNILLKCRESIEFARTSLNEGQSSEVIIMDLRVALDYLGEITGETTSIDILNNIFGNFCIGK